MGRLCQAGGIGGEPYSMTDEPDSAPEPGPEGTLYAARVWLRSQGASNQMVTFQLDGAARFATEEVTSEWALVEIDSSTMPASGVTITVESSQPSDCILLDDLSLLRSDVTPP